MGSLARFRSLSLALALGVSVAAVVVVRLGFPAEAARVTGFVDAGVGALVPGRAVRGLRIDGRELARGDDVVRVVRDAAARLEGTHVRVEDPPSGFSRDTTLSALGLHVDVSHTLELATSIGRKGSVAARLSERLDAQRGAVDVPLAIDVDPSPLVALVVSRKEAADTRPTSARHDFAASTAKPHRAGSLLDADRAVDALWDLVRERRGLLSLPRREVLPRVTTEVVDSTDVREVVASYKTGFSFQGREAPRAHNIEVAASRLDGLVLMPGQIVSFNAEVGPRTVDAGFDRAFQIYKGEMVEGVGGGTCQVASTFHAAAVYGGLDVVERAPHSRPLGYVPLGLDATVVYPEVDLKIKNPWNFPVAVHAFVEKGLVTVEIRAPRRTGPVVVSTETLKVWPFIRKVEVHPELASGRFIRKEKGIRGYDIRVVRRSTSVDGIPQLETSIDRYPATPELFWVAPGLDVEHALPPPPEGEVPSATSDADPKPADGTVIPG